MSIAVDIDGVLCNQVQALKKWIWDKYRYRLYKKDVTSWNHSFLDTNFSTEIMEALKKPNFVLTMPVYHGAIEAMKNLSKRYHTVIATSRPTETERHTITWLEKYFTFNEFHNTLEKGKHRLSADILIDDHLENVKQFAENNPYAILFDQPWNKNRFPIQKLIRKKKIRCCKGWRQTVNTINNIADNQISK